MGIEVSTSFAMVLLATLIALGMFYPAANGAVEQVSGADSDRMADYQHQVGSAFAIRSASWDDGELTLRLENTGSTTLAVNATDLLADGTYVGHGSFAETWVDGDSNAKAWNPGEVLRIVVPMADPGRLVVVTEHGIKAPRNAVPDLNGDRLVFTNGDELQTMAGNGSSITTAYEVSDAAAIGPIELDPDGDGVKEVPFANLTGQVAIADESPERTNLTVGARADLSRLAIGSWRGSDRSVFYVNDSTGDIRRVTADGRDLLVASVTAQGVAGIADFDGDGKEELVFGGESPNGTSETVNYVDGDGETIVATGTEYGVNNGIGLGEPADFDGDGTARTPIVDGSQDVALVSANGTVTTLTSSGPASRAPVASADVDSDDELEIVFVSSSNELQYVDDVAGTNTVRTLFDNSGAAVTADDDAGVA